MRFAPRAIQQKSILSAAARQKAAALTTPGDLRAIIGIMVVVAWLNLCVGLMSLLLYIHGFHFIMLPIVGMLAVTTFCLLLMKVRYMSTTRTWMEVWATALYGICCPTFVFAITLMTLMSAIHGAALK